MLEPIASDVWTTARPQAFWGVECGTRTTIVLGTLKETATLSLEAAARAAKEDA